MRILYGVVGEGMGHATRSRVVIEHLLAAGHEVKVVVSGRAHGFLSRKLAGRAGVSLEEIEGLHLVVEDNDLDVSESIWENLDLAPARLVKNLEVYGRVVGAFTPDVVVSDFESWAYVFGKLHDIPVISLDNMQVIARCWHDEDVVGKWDNAARFTQLAVKLKLPGAYHYLITSFFFPKIRKKKTTLAPPILRAEILEAAREPGEHVLVYQTASTNTQLIPALQRMPFEFRVYGMGREGQEGNVSLRGFSETGFVDDLRTAKAAIAGGGFSLMGECVHLGVPLLSVPIEDQYEQELNARYLDGLGYGRYASSLDEDTVRAFLEEIPRFDEALTTYPRQDNSMLLTLVDEVITCAAAGVRPPARLTSPAMGKLDDD
jgi:uncharacterized protein (TIGR00661 family)